MYSLVRLLTKVVLYCIDTCLWRWKALAELLGWASWSWCSLSHVGNSWFSQNASHFLHNQMQTLQKMKCFVAISLLVLTTNYGHLLGSSWARGDWKQTLSLSKINIWWNLFSLSLGAVGRLCSTIVAIPRHLHYYFLLPYFTLNIQTP